MQRLLLGMTLVILGLTGSCGGRSASDGLLNPQVADPAVIAADSPVPDGVDPQVWKELTDRLARELTRQGAAIPAPAVPQGAAGTVADLHLEITGETAAQLKWSYVNLGDYNQDRMVTAADLTPVGIYFEHNTESPDWPIASRADGNGDGYIGLADVTVIGQNYQHRVDGYRIEESANPGVAESWQPHAAVEFAAAVLNAQGSCLEFNSGEATLQEGMSYRVAPYAEIALQPEYGPASNIATWTGSPPEAPLGLNASKGEFVGRITLTWTSVPDASYYLVYRDQTDSEIGLTMSPVYEENVTGDYGAHRYWVRAGNALGESELSAEDEGFSGLAVPTGLTASAGLFDDRVELTWELVDGAEGYEVFLDGGETPVGVTGDVGSWVDSETDLTLQTYRIKAVNALCSSQRSTAVQGFRRSSPVNSWNQAGANAQHSYSTATIGPTAPEVKWTRYFNTTAHSSPVLSLDEGVVYAGSRDNRVHAFGRLTREHLWSFVTTDDVVAQPVLNLAGQLFVGNAAGRFYCINPDGTEAWHHDAPGAVTHRAALADSGEVLFLTAEGNLVCLDSSGAELWSFSCIGPGIGHPVVHSDGNVYALAGDYNTGYRVHALSANGLERWQYGIDQRLYSSPALDQDGNVYFNEHTSAENYIVRLDQDGDEVWRYMKETYIDGCTPVVSDTGMVYVADGPDYWASGFPVLHAINPDGTQAWLAASGEVACESEVILGPDGNIYLCNVGYYTLECYSTAGTRLWWLTDEEYNSAHTAFPVIATDGMVLMIDYDGNLRSYIPSSEDLSSYTQINLNNLEAVHIAGEPVFSNDGTIYMGGDVLRAMSPAGDELWSNPNLPTVGAAVDAGGNVYAAGGQSLYAYTPDGTIQWTLSGEHDDFEKSPTLFNDRLYFSGGKVVDTDGELVWETGTGAYFTPVVSSNGLAYWLGIESDPELTLHGYQSDGIESFTVTLDEDDYISGLAVDPMGTLRTKSRAGLVQSFDAWLIRQWVYGPDGSMPSSYGGLAIGSDGSAYGSFGLGVLEPARVRAVTATGEPLWSYEHAERCFNKLVVDGAGYIYFCDDSGYLFSLKPDGGERWRLDLTDAKVKSIALSPDGTLYVVGPYQNLFAIGDTT